MEEKISILMSIKPTIMGGRPSAYWNLADALREKEIILFFYSRLMVRHHNSL